MAEAIRGRGKLAYKFLLWFLLISLAPMGVVGWHLIDISQTVLKEESLRHQQSLAVGFAETVSNYTSTFKTVLTIASRLEGFATMDPVKQERHLNRVMQQHAAFLEVSVFDAAGRETVRMGRFLGAAPQMRDFADQDSFRAALDKGDYMGGLTRFQGLYPTLTLAVPILESGVGQTVKRGVLLGRVSLNGLSQMLRQEFPEKGRSQAAVVAGDVRDSFLVAHSNPAEAFKTDARLPEEILKVILTQTAKRGGGEVALSDGTRVLGAFAEIKDVGWIVYVQQPIESAYLAATQMKAQVLRVLLWVVVITLLLSLAVAGHITQPIRVLQQAAEHLTAGRFEDLPEMTLTNDEIGDLAQSFVQMSDSLKEKTGELLHAKEELTKYGRDLERRVEARTRELKAAQDELIKKERLAAIGQMASVVGHEIRNPLAVINNSIFFIKTKMAKEATIDPKIERHISIIQSEVKQANSIIDEILTYSRTREMKPEVTKLNGWIDEVLSVYPFPPHIRVEKSLDARDPVVAIDQDQMKQAVRNLIGNGIEVMPQQGAVRVATSIVEKGWVRLDIGDTGPGIPQDVLEKIFTPFYTTKARGTGLGLAVVKKVADGHGGRIDVATEIGRGTTFSLFLPLFDPNRPSQPSQAGAAARPAVKPPITAPASPAARTEPPQTARAMPGTRPQGT
ncbi:MAG: HAMP domain-containing protein [Elusimicrobia bacterium]|nr:HAMP domain-containing protein [Elusimicrobiota bacterium]